MGERRASPQTAQVEKSHWALKCRCHCADQTSSEGLQRSGGAEDIFVKRERYLGVPLCLRPRGVHKKYLSSIRWIFQLWSSGVSQCPPAGIPESAKRKARAERFLYSDNVILTRIRDNRSLLKT